MSEKTVRVAFTGRRDEMPMPQRMKMAHIVNTIDTTLISEGGSFRLLVSHNNSPGADQYFHRLCHWLNFGFENHPGIVQRLRPMPMNRALVSWCDILIGCPPTEHLLKKGSGTWQTILYGFKYGKDVRIITPRGEVITKREDIPRESP